MTLRLGFYGGAGTVTGSRFLLETDRTRVLIDCGLFQGLKELRLRNWQPVPFEVDNLDAVLLTHAHIDHSGYLPRLVKEGYRGPIYCTRATAELAPILLTDAAKLQEEDAEYANRKGFSKHHPALPLYTEADARHALARFKPVQMDHELRIGDFTIVFRDAGHILGASFLEIRCHEGGQEHRVVFSGDLGRERDALHTDPDPLPACDTLVLESTYGNRKHSRSSLIERIRGPFLETFNRRGIVLIPAFAVARAQMVLLMLSDLMDEGRLPRVPIHIDSPMAVDVTSIYRKYAGTERLDEELGKHDLYPKNVTFHRTAEESIKLNNLKGPRIIISSSGMLTGGRVLHHLKRLLPQPENLIVLVGYQAAGTRGRSLLAGAPTVRVHGIDVPARAQLLQVQELSAHADADELVEWVRSAPQPPATTFLVHGEPDSLAALQDRMAFEGTQPIVPELNQGFELTAEGDWHAVEPPRSARRRAEG